MKTRTPQGGYARGYSRVALIGAVFVLLSACGGSPQEREAKRLRQGKGYLDKKDYKRAAIEFKVAAQNMPRDAEPVYQLGMTYLKAGAVRLGLEALQKASAINPKHEGARYQLALFGVGSNKPEAVEDARNVIAEYLGRHAGDVEALGALALAEAKLGHKERAMALLEQAVARDGSNLRGASMVLAVYAARGDTDAARTIVRRLTERAPSSPAAAVLRAQVSLAAKDLKDGDAEISRALALQRDFRPALELRLKRELMTNDGADAEATTQQLAKLPERSAWAAYARILFSEEKFDEGIAEFHRLLRKHGDDNRLRDEFSSLLLSSHHRKEAEAVVAGTLRKDPKDRAALLQRVELEIDRGELDAAAGDVKTLEELKAFSPQLTYQLSRIYGARGELARQGDTLAEAVKANPRLLAGRLELARVMVTLGKPKNALQVLDQALPREKSTAEFIYYRNLALMAAGEWAEARKSVNAGLAAARTPGFLYQDALMKTREHDVAGARKSLEAGFRMAPTDPLTVNFLGELMRQQGEGAKFAALLRDAAGKNPGSALLQNTLGKQLAAQGDKAGARAAFEAAKADGDLTNPDIEIATLDLQEGKADQARQRLEELTKAHDSAAARVFLAEMESRRGAAPDVLIRHYLQALKLEPANVVAMNNLAEVLSARQNKFDDALFWAQKALALAPTNPVLEDTAGWIFYREGRFDAAVPYLEKSVKGMDRPLAHYHLAGALAKAGDPARGRREYELAVKEDPKSPARAAVSPLFEPK